MVTEQEIHALDPDDALRIDHDEAHLGDTPHSAHGLPRLWEHVVLSGHGQTAIEEHRKGDPCDLQEPA